MSTKTASQEDRVTAQMLETVQNPCRHHLLCLEHELQLLFGIEVDLDPPTETAVEVREPNLVLAA